MTFKQVFGIPGELRLRQPAQGPAEAASAELWGVRSEHVKKELWEIKSLFPLTKKKKKERKKEKRRGDALCKAILNQQRGLKHLARSCGTLLQWGPSQPQAKARPACPVEGQCCWWATPTRFLSPLRCLHFWPGWRDLGSEHADLLCGPWTWGAWQK